VIPFIETKAAETKFSIFSKRIFVKIRNYIFLSLRSPPDIKWSRFLQASKDRTSNIVYWERNYWYKGYNKELVSLYLP
jgi:hypothetical protein